LPKLRRQSATEAGQADRAARQVSAFDEAGEEEPAVMTNWSVYILRCSDGSLYTGIATDVRRRFAEHEKGARGAKYLRGRRPLELVFERDIGDRSLALRIEHRVKRLPRALKQDLARLPGRIDALVNEMTHAVSPALSNQ
jgi:putative endonuclease